MSDGAAATADQTASASATGATLDKLGTIMLRAHREAIARAEREAVPMRLVSRELGIERVLEAAKDRGYV